MLEAIVGWEPEPRLELALAMPDEVRARLAARARRFVDRNFSLEQTGEATMRVYRELLEGRAPDAAGIA